MEKNAINSFFVYGTLKRNQIRESCWPCSPTSIQFATTKGQLYDLGPYPAMIAGDENVGGEVWTFQPEDIQQTRWVLDKIEGFKQREDDLYIRQVVRCAVESQPEPVAAYSYFFAHPTTLAPQQRMRVKDGMMNWPSLD